MKNKKVLVTGGAGFIGSHLCETLLETGNEVVCVDNLSMGSSENIKKFGSENFKFVKADVTVFNDLKRVFDEYDFDFVFHEAAVVGVKRTLENPLSVLSDIEGFKNVLELSKESGVEKLIFSSSSEVYGNPVEIPEREDGHVNASFPYATVKLIGEQYCRAYYDTYGLKTTSLRFFNVYGPRQESTPYGFVVGIFIRQALQDMAPTIFGDGSQTRNFVFVKDNVGLTILAAESKRTDGEVLNIGTGKPTTLIDLAELIIELCGKEGKLTPQFLPERLHEIKHRFPDISRMMRLLDSRPKYRLEDGLKETIEYYRIEPRDFTRFPQKRENERYK